MTLNIYHVIRRPVVTEKSTKLDEGLNQVVFEVDAKANKNLIKEAVEKIFKVKVEGVNTMRMKGKPLRRGLHFARKSNWKKAIVTLREGERIDFYEGA